MLFNSLAYIRPIWYFNLQPKIDWGYFPSPDQLDALGTIFPMDSGYMSEKAQNRDRAFVAFQSGFINRKYTAGLSIWEKVELPAQDEYRFLRKNVHSAWVFYVLLLRLLTFHNPISEIAGFIKTRRVKRLAYAKQPFLYPDYDSFKSILLQSNPFVSVIIPTLNRYTYLNDVLNDLEQQDYKNFEVIVVDQSEPYQSTFYEGRKLNLRHWYQKEKALWKARNEAIQAAKGDWILLYDDDSRIDSDWITQHLKTIDFFQADLSSGVSLSVIGAEIPEHYSYFRWSDQLDTGNVLLKKTIFDAIGFFDLQFEKQRMGDGEYGLRAYLNGFKNISNPKAKRIHLKVSEGGLRQMGSWDAWRPKKLFGAKPVPSVLYFSRKYYGNLSSYYFICTSLMPSIIPYRLKSSKSLKIISFFVIPVILPLLLFQIIKSWSISTKMLNK